MNRTTRAALVASICTSTIAVGDAVWLGITGDNLLGEGSARWWAAVADTVHAVTYGLLAAALTRGAVAVERGSRFRHALRLLLTTCLVVLAVGFGVLAATGETPAVLQVPVGLCFGLLFVLGAVLGVGHLGRRGSAAAGRLLVAPLALLPLAFVVDAFAPRWAHPGWAEAALYIGLASVSAGTGTSVRARKWSAATPLRRSQVSERSTPGAGRWVSRGRPTSRA